MGVQGRGGVCESSPWWEGEEVKRPSQAGDAPSWGAEGDLEPEVMSIGSCQARILPTCHCHAQVMGTCRAEVSLLGACDLGGFLGSVDQPGSFRCQLATPRDQEQGSTERGWSR